MKIQNGWSKLKTVGGSFHYYFKGKFCAAKTVCDAIEYDTWTGCPKMIPKGYRRLCTYPLALLKRKVMVYPADETMTSYLVIDPDQPVVCWEIAIPYYPKINEVVRVKSAHLNSPDLIMVKQVHHDTRIFEGHKVQAVRGSCHNSVLSRMIRVKVSDVLCSVPYRLNAGCVYIDDYDWFDSLIMSHPTLLSQDYVGMYLQWLLISCSKHKHDWWVMYWQWNTCMYLIYMGPVVSWAPCKIHWASTHYSTRLI